MIRGVEVNRRCRCGSEFEARVADVKRGWAKFCSKSCKAKEQEKRTGQYADYKHRQELDAGEGLFYAHGFDNTEHQNHGD